MFDSGRRVVTFLPLREGLRQRWGGRWKTREPARDKTRTERSEERGEGNFHASDDRDNHRQERQRESRQKEKKRFTYTQLHQNTRSYRWQNTHTKHLGQQLQVIHQPAPPSIQSRQETKNLVRVVLFILVFLIFLVLLLLFQLLLPHVVCSFGVDAREDEVKDFAVPCYWSALDAFFDVLLMN